MTERRKARRGPTAAVVAIVALACISAVLVFFALRTEPIPDAGQTPLVPLAPSATADATPRPPASPSATPGPADAGGQTRFLDAVDGRIAARATAGSCAGAAPTVEITSDGGATWVPAPLPAEDGIRQILALEVVDADQIDLVVLAGAECDPNLLSTFTAGQFWQLYPERLATKSYLDTSASPAGIVIAGATVAAPCEAPLELTPAPEGVALRCADIAAVSTAAPGAWLAVTASTLTGIAWDPTAGPASLLAGVQRAGTCDGLAITRLPADGSDFEGTVVGCAPAGTNPATAVLASGAGAVWLWSDTGSAVSTDGGTTWAGT